MKNRNNLISKEKRMMDREEFARQYKQDVAPINIQKYEQARQREQITRQQRRTRQQSRYTAPKGTMARARKKKRRPRTKLAALILAAALGLGGIGLINQVMAKTETVSIVEMQENGINPQSLGLSAETIQLFEKYDNYFANFDEKDKQNLTDEQVISMISEIEGMHFSTVKEKMGDLLGESPKNIEMHYGFDKADGNTHTSITVSKSSGGREAYTNDKTWPFPTKNTIPSELADTIIQLDDLSDLKSDLKTDRITKINAIKELRKLYELVTFCFFLTFLFFSLIVYNTNIAFFIFRELSCCYLL